MATTPIDESIARKIQALLEMANRAQGNENEAAVAMGKAQELLAKYNLELADLESHAKKNGKQETGKRGYANIGKSAMYEWQQKLVAAIAHCNFCVCWITTENQEYKTRKWGGLETAYRKVKRYQILGREANTVTVTHMVEYLFNTIERLLPFENKDRLSRDAISWRRGVADRLRERIWAKYEEMRKADYATQGESGYTTALALVRVDKSEEIANYEFRYGVGSWAAKEEQNRIWEENQKDKEAALALERSKETPAQKAAREAKERQEAEKAQREWEKVRARYEREQKRKDAQVNWNTYFQGQRVGDEINLDSQLTGTRIKGEL